MSSRPVDVNPFLRESEPTLIPDEGILRMRQAADAIAQLETTRVACYQLLQELGISHNVANAAHLGESPALPISEIYPQLGFMRVACYQLLQVLEPPYNVSNPSPQLEFVWGAYYQLLQVYRSLLDECNAAQLGERQGRRDPEITETYPQVMERVPSLRSNLLTLALRVALADSRLAFVSVACYQFLQVYDMLPNEYNASQLGEHQVLPAPEAAQRADAQEARFPVGGDTSGRVRCLIESCSTTFKRPQERNRHVIDVHTPRRRCPLCLYEWCRPDKIKAHLVEDHHDELPPEVMNEICARRGQHLVAFLTPAL